MNFAYFDEEYNSDFINYIDHKEKNVISNNINDDILNNINDDLNNNNNGLNNDLNINNLNNNLINNDNMNILNEKNINLENSMQKIFPFENDRKILEKDIPLIIFCGLANSGKTSIIQVLYNKISPHETVSLPSTKQANILEINSDSKLFPTLGLIDLPGNGQLQDNLLNEEILNRISSIVFVIDSQNDPYDNEIFRAKKLFKKALQFNKNILFEIFLHKTDTETFSIDDDHLESQRDIHEKISSFVFQYGFEIDIRYHFTSIYNDSVLEAFSKVIQKVSPYTQIFERLLDILVISSSLEKALLMDIHSRTFLACDSSLFDPIGFELCADILNVITEITEIYAPECNIAKTSDISCFVKLDTGHFLHIKDIDHNIVIACVIRSEQIKNSSLIDINIDIFKQTLHRKFLNNK